MLYAIYLCCVLAVAVALLLWRRRVRRLNILYLRQREKQFNVEFGDESFDESRSDRVSEFLIRQT
jgi:hypothetical protein